MTFVDPPKDKILTTSGNCGQPLRCQRGHVLAHGSSTLATRLLLAPTLLLLAVSTAVANPRDGRNPSTSTALARAGTAAIEARRFADALEAFTKASALRPGDATLCFGAGVAAFMLGQDGVAQSRFECALAVNPNHLQAAMWLGDLHYRAGRLAEAIAIYESAWQRTPGVPLQQQIDRWRKEHELQSRFHEVRSEHFTALFEFDESRAREVVDRLEAAYARIGGMLRVYPAKPITVVLYTREQFGDITKLATWSVAAYDGRIRLPLGDALEQREELDRVLSHEFVHAVVATLGGRNVPAWVNEGLATVLEPAGTQEAESTPPRNADRLRLSTLHEGFQGFSTRDAELAYSSSAWAVQRLIDLRGIGALVALLEDLARGAPFDRAFHQRVAMRYEDFAALVARD